MISNDEEMENMNKRILHIVGDSKFGGGSVIILKLAEMARNIGCEVDVLTTDKEFSSHLKAHGFGVVSLDVIRRETRPLKDLLGCFKLYRFLRNTNYDLIHTHTSKAGMVGRLAAWAARCPAIIHTVHGFAFHEETSTAKLKVFAVFEKIATFWCHRVVTVSKFHREWALQLGIGNSCKVIAIPNGVGEIQRTNTDDRNTIRDSLGVAHDSFMLFYGGRLAPQKGLEYLIEALPSIKEIIDVPISLVLAGDGPLVDCLNELVSELDIGCDVFFLGFRRDVADLLFCSDLVVLPSLREGLSISLLEAMSASKPIITTKIGSNLEVTKNGECAILVPVKSVEELSVAIIDLYYDRDKCLDLARKARSVYLSEYTENHMLLAYREVYERHMK